MYLVRRYADGGRMHACSWLINPDRTKAVEGTVKVLPPTQSLTAVKLEAPGANRSCKQHHTRRDSQPINGAHNTQQTTLDFRAASFRQVRNNEI